MKKEHTSLDELKVLNCKVKRPANAFAIVNYPIYKKNLAGRRKKYAGKIIELSDSIMKG